MKLLQLLLSIQFLLQIKRVIMPGFIHFLLFFIKCLFAENARIAKNAVFRPKCLRNGCKNVIS